jgi:hypothetical protein
VDGKRKMHEGNYLRTVAVTSVDYSQNSVETIWTDDGEPGPTLSIPHPFSGLGEGVFVGIRPGTIIVVDRGSYERYIPLATIPLRALSASDIGSIDDVSIDMLPFPEIDGGEIFLQGSQGNGVYLDNLGNIQTFNPFGEGTFLGGDSARSSRVGINVIPPTQYIISEAGLFVNGMVRRDTNLESEDDLDVIVSPLTDPDYEQFLEEVGRDPLKSVEIISPGQQGSIKDVNKKNFRNPGFVENRQLVLEYGREFAVSNSSDEIKRLKEGVLSKVDPNNRHERRNNVLGMSLHHPNELIEIVHGTLVDFFGNPLDLNKSKLPAVSAKNEKEYYEQLEYNARRTIVFLKEINTRKGYSFRSDNIKPYTLKGAPKPNLSENNSRDRSKWSVAVDKEGVTKINIPASSETGNVPVLARAENSSSLEFDSDGNPKKINTTDSLAISRDAKNQQDIFLDQVGPGGISVSGQKYKNRLSGDSAGWNEAKAAEQPKEIEAGTAFHDITKTAATLLEKDANRVSTDVSANSPPSVTADGGAVSSSIDNEEPTALDKISNFFISRDDAGRLSSYPNAGGRSVQASLDGSLELSLGANTVDRVSWMLDTAGGIVARLGRDRYGRSAIIQSDGSVFLEVGGYDYVGSSSSDKTDTRFVGGGVSRTQGLKKDTKRFRAGKVVIRVKGSTTKTADQIIIIDDSGITLDSSKRIDINSKGDLNLQSKAAITIDAPRIKFFKDDMSREMLRIPGKPIT